MAESEIIKDLIHLVAEGNRDAFGRFFEVYYGKVYRFAGYFLVSEVMCEEVVSDVFLSVWQSRKHLDRVENMQAYLYTVTRNQALHYKNAHKNRTDVTLDHLPIGLLQDNHNPEAVLITTEVQQAIDESIKELPERCQLIFLMAKEEGLKYREIAEILSISEKTVNAQMVSAIKKLGLAIRKHLSVLL